MGRILSTGQSKLWRQCDEVLHYLWDPIGVADVPEARDEYSGYVNGVCDFLRSGATASEVAEYLIDIEARTMSLSPHRDRALEVAECLIDWCESLDEGRLEETEFWLRMEHRISAEMQRLDQARALDLWCDWLEPSKFGLGDSPPYVTGESWVGVGPRSQEKWTFRAIVPKHLPPRSEIDWRQLLPPDDASGWLTVEIPDRVLVLDLVSSPVPRREI